VLIFNALPNGTESARFLHAKSWQTLRVETNNKH
jgi:hypothetical protein